MLIEGPAQCLMLADWPGLINSAVWSEEEGEEENEEERGGEEKEDEDVDKEEEKRIS